MNIEQIKAARAMLGMSQKDLAREAGLSVATLNNIERGAQTDPKISTLNAIRRVLEHTGIEFVNGYGGIGVTLKTVRDAVAGATVLIVDDSREDRTLYKHWLGCARRRKYRVIEADGAPAALGAFRQHAPDCVVLDFKMFGADGFQLLAEMKKERARMPPVVFVTGLHNDVLKESAVRQGVAAYLNKRHITQEGFNAAVENAIT